MARCRVLVVDDSAVMRQVLQVILSSDPEIEVVGTAPDPFIAQSKIMRLKPDVVTLDVEMPRMDGLTFLEKLMRSCPMPVVMISTQTDAGCDATLRALQLGAVDFVTKPRLDPKNGTIERAAEIIAKVKAAARARVAHPGVSTPVTAQPLRMAPPDAAQRVIAIGASTGGTEAIRTVLRQMPADCPGIVMVQHMPERFTTTFAQHLDAESRIRVSEARDGDRVLPGYALLAPGNYHMELLRNGSDYRVRITQTERVNHHRPSVDLLFRSCARHAGANAVGAILTGMGNDGAAGMLEMRNAGAYNIAQDERSCVVFGMPREAIENGSVHEVASLDKIPQALLRSCTVSTELRRRVG